MNIKQLKNKLLKRRFLRLELVKAVKEFDKETNNIQKELEMAIISENPQTKATNLWCKITNALISKYKIMSEENPDEAVKQLTMLEGALLAGKFLTQEELSKGL